MWRNTMKPSTYLKSVNLKATRQRVAVLTVLIDSLLPLNINQIRSLLDIEMDLSTLYRTLDTFFDKDLISKTVPLEPSQTVYELKRDGHKHYLICVKCHSMQIVNGCPIHDYEHEVESKTGFIIDRHQLELYGLCPKCQVEQI